MPITTQELRWYYPATVSTVASTNGGRRSTTEIVAEQKNNLFPDVSSVDRSQGIEQFRKLFIGLRDDDNLTLIETAASIEHGTPGDSYTLVYEGTHTDVQQDLQTAITAGTIRPYGYGKLTIGANAGATSITVTAEHAAYGSMSQKPFQVGDMIRLDARTTVNDSGFFEFATIASITYNGAQVSIGLSGGLDYSYAANAAVVSVIAKGNLNTSVADVQPTGLFYDHMTYPIVVPQIGSIYQTWTLTVTNASTKAFSISGDTLGVIAQGDMDEDCWPASPTGGYYFKLDKDGWGTTFALNDTLVFTTIPADVPLWARRIVPAGSGYIQDDTFSLCIEGETA